MEYIIHAMNSFVNYYYVFQIRLLIKFLCELE
jgi:hypothetical protein